MRNFLKKALVVTVLGTILTLIIPGNGSHVDAMFTYGGGGKSNVMTQASEMGLFMD